MVRHRREARFGPHHLIWPGPAVAVELKNGRTIQIGNTDADALLAALNG